MSSHPTSRGTLSSDDRRDLLALACALAVCLALAVGGLSKPLVYDEVDFAKAAAAVARSGVPLYDRGWIADYPERPDSGAQYQYALYHPPLYVYLLAGSFRLFGESEAAARSVGLLGLACSLLLLYALGRTLFQVRAAGLLAAGLWALSPFAIQSALLLDIDGTILTPLVLAFVLLFVRGRDRVAAGVLALALAAKLTAPALVGLGLVVHFSVRRERAQLARLGRVVAAGTTLFLVSWLVLAALLLVPWDQPFLDASYAFRDTTRTSSGSLLLAASVAVRLLQWLHPGFLVLSVGSFLLLVKNRGVNEHLREGSMLAAWLALFGMGAYLTRIAGAFPKYQIVGFAFAVLLVAGGLATALATARRRALALALGAAVGTAASAAATRLDGLLYATDPLLLAGWLLGLAAPFALAGRLGVRTPLALGLGALVGGWVAVAVGQAGAPYSTTYFYGVTCWREAAIRLAEVVRPGDLVVADREVAYYARHDRFVDTERALQGVLSASSTCAGLGVQPWMELRTPPGPPAPPVEPIRAVASRGVGVLLGTASSGRGALEHFGSYVVWSPRPCVPGRALSAIASLRRGEPPARPCRADRWLTSALPGLDSW